MSSSHSRHHCYCCGARLVLPWYRHGEDCRHPAVMRARERSVLGFYHGVLFHFMFDLLTRERLKEET